MLEALGVETGPRRRRDHSARFIHSTGAETEDHSDSDQKALGMMGLVRRDTALLLRDLRLGASSWLNSFLELSGHKSQPKSVPIAGEPSLTHPPRMPRRDSLVHHKSWGRIGAVP